MRHKPAQNCASDGLSMSSCIVPSLSIRIPTTLSPSGCTIGHALVPGTANLKSRAILSHAPSLELGRMLGLCSPADGSRRATAGCRTRSQGGELAMKFDVTQRSSLSPDGEYCICTGDTSRGSPTIAWYRGKGRCRTEFGQGPFSSPERRQNRAGGQRYRPSHGIAGRGGVELNSGKGRLVLLRDDRIELGDSDTISTLHNGARDSRSAGVNVPGIFLSVIIRDALADNDSNVVMDAKVHCFMGVSRSATVVCTYLVATANMTAADALSAVKEMRSVVNTNFGFVRQLQVYAEKVYGPMGKSR
ncbi:hypothetical protein BV25DRAFT_1837002 [Artomyces pyxidatus]|uniref:Uncharacterized protein n=1 Tax=Artomyces pyxidatus TaxID=48021 RepID=A0ACB8T6V1_9AGAM|nr:hypothetical protein BV25DRAFT_1837002 [Artomyces pyxidatus]